MHLLLLEKNKLFTFFVLLTHSLLTSVLRGAKVVEMCSFNSQHERKLSRLSNFFSTLTFS